MTKTTTDGLQILDDMIGNDAELQALCEQATVNIRVAQLIYEARKEAGLSQKQLATMVNTTQSVISCLENADYEGYSLSMLGKIATALGREVKIDLAPVATSVAKAS